MEPSRLFAVHQIEDAFAAQCEVAGVFKFDGVGRHE